MLGLLFLDILNLDVTLRFLSSILIFGGQAISHLLVLDIISFIDEYYRCTWIYLMKDCSELLSIFMSFLNDIKNQFGKVINVLRSGNAKQYFTKSKVE